MKANKPKAQESPNKQYKPTHAYLPKKDSATRTKTKQNCTELKKLGLRLWALAKSLFPSVDLTFLREH